MLEAYDLEKAEISLVMKLFPLDCDISEYSGTLMVGNFCLNFFMMQDIVNVLQHYYLVHAELGKVIGLGVYVAVNKIFFCNPN